MEVDSDDSVKNWDKVCHIHKDSGSMKGDVSAGDMDEKEIDLDGVGKTVDRDDKLDLEGVPVDRGWAWILLLGIIFIFVILKF